MIRRVFGQKNSLRARITQLFLGAIVLVSLLTLYLVQSAAYRHSKSQLDAHHLAASRVVADRLETRATLLRNGVIDLTGNFSVKQLIAGGTEDAASLVVAMENYRQRLGADTYLVLDDAGDILTSSISIEQFPYDPQDFAGEGLSWADFLGDHLLLKSAPLRYVPGSPRVNAWLLMGQRSSSLIGEELVALTGMQVSLVELEDSPAVWGSTLDEDIAQKLASALARATSDVSEVQLGNTELAVGVNQLPGRPVLETVVSTTLESAYLPYQSLLLQVGVFLLLAALASALAVLRLSRSITGPIDALVSAANLISRGKDADDFPKQGSAEVRVLAQAFEDMQDGIRQREQQINRLAYFDTLTGLPNRNRFVTRLEEMLLDERATGLTVAILDVDRFKEVNDTVGHSSGDHLIRLIAKRLSAWARDEDFLARIGGDEFALISADRSQEEASHLAENLSSLFSTPFSLNGLSLDVNASIGLSVAPEHGEEAQLLLRRADIAMYAAKGGHGHFAVYEDSLDKHSVQRLSLMSELKEALADGQLFLTYQPKQTLKNGSIDCVECLIRWQHPNFGMVRPDDFIPLAEQTGAIRHVTQWAIAAALSQQAAWNREGVHLDLAVNISALDLSDQSLPTYVEQLQIEHQLAPGSLTLEITEGAIMNDPDTAIQALESLQKMGVKLSIDDFGTGFSSMAQLKRMPVSELKIDKAFVQSLATNSDDRVMVKTLIALASNLGLQTVAEGVEDEISLRLLREMGCDRAQGYFISRPETADSFQSWLQQRTTQVPALGATA
ncbi:MAG: EAL domain-containing protein [Pseudomonadota bacterium]